MLIFRLYRATPYSQTFEPWKKKFSKKKKIRHTSEIHLLISLKSGTNDKLSHFCDKNLLNSCCTGAIKEDLQSCSSLIVILRVSWGEKFTKGNKSSNISSKPLSNYFKTNYLNALNFINTSSLLYFFSASFLLDKLLNKITILNSILNSLNEYPPLNSRFLNFRQLIGHVNFHLIDKMALFSREKSGKKSKQNTIRSLSREIHGKAARQKARIEFLPVLPRSTTSLSPSSSPTLP